METNANSAKERPILFYVAVSYLFCLQSGLHCGHEHSEHTVPYKPVPFCAFTGIKTVVQLVKPELCM